MIWLVNLVSALLQICCLLSMAAFFINILLFTYVDYNLHILVVCRGGHISYFIWSNIRYVTDDITIVKTLPPLFSLFFFIVKTIDILHSNMCYVLDSPSRSPILHKGHLERYDKQQGNESVSQFFEWIVLYISLVYFFLATFYNQTLKYICLHCFFDCFLW